MAVGRVAVGIAVGNKAPALEQADLGPGTGQHGNFVLVGNDGDVYESVRGGEPHRLTWGWVEQADRRYYAWPVFSPAGDRLACLGVCAGQETETDSALYLVERDGVSMRELWRSTQVTPVCHNWSADGRHIAILYEASDGLHLDLVSRGGTVGLDGPTVLEAVEHGSPLFWSWSPDPVGGLLAVHVGGSASLSEDARLLLLDVGECAVEVASLEPGEFRVPVWSPAGDRLAYVDASAGEQEFLAVYRVEDGVSEIVCPVEGHVVMDWSRDGRTLAISQALGESPHVFTGVTLVDVRSGNTRVVHDSDVVSFFWAGKGNRLVSVGVDEGQGVRISVFDDKGDTNGPGPLLIPSPEMTYFLQFFDQFAVSHPLVSADGRSMLLSGRLTAAGGNPDDNRANSVYLVDLDDGSLITELAQGCFACWSGG